MKKEDFFCSFHIDFLVRHNTKHNNAIIAADMNAYLDKCENNKFCSYNSLKRNGEYLAEFSLGKS